ncbi:MAG: hypothetical protein AAF591_13195 [Verrucomicrobiota bacterium]
MAIDIDGEGIAGREVEGLGEVGGEGDGIGVGEPGIEVEGLGGIRGGGGLDLAGEEGEIGEDIDADDAKVFAGVIGEGGVCVGERGGCCDAGVLGDFWEEGFVEAGSGRGTDFEVAFAGDDIDTGAKAFGGGVVGDLDGEVNGDAEGDGEDVEEGDEPVADGVSEDGGVEEGDQGSVGSYSILIEYGWRRGGEANFWGEIRGQRSVRR